MEFSTTFVALDSDFDTVVRIPSGVVALLIFVVLSGREWSVGKSFFEAGRITL
jgi:hypothetical protein